MNATEGFSFNQIEESLDSPEGIYLEHRMEIRYLLKNNFGRVILPWLDPEGVHVLVD